MVRFKELFTRSKFITDLGALRFANSQFDDGTVRTPHEEMEQATLGYMYRPQINSGIRQLALFLLGNNIAIESKDPKTKEFLNTWMDKRQDNKKKLNDFVTSALITGNAYLEMTYAKRPDASMILDNFFTITDSVRVYRNLASDKDEEYWVYEVPTELKKFPFRNVNGEVEQLSPHFYFINYVQSSSTIFRRSVYGIPIDKQKIRHFKWGWSRDMIYGRSFLMSSIDDIEIVREIIKNWSIISRYRALNSKIISIGDENNRASADDINKLEEDFRVKKDSEHIILNKPHTVDSLSNVGEYDDMSAPVDFLRKDIGSGLVPNYLTPWNSEVNRATSEETRLVFAAQLEAMQGDIITFLNKEIIDELRKSYSWIAEDATFVIEKIDMEPKSEKLTYAPTLFESNIITLNEYRELLGMQSLPDGNKFNKDLQSGDVDAPETGDITLGDDSDMESFREAANPYEDDITEDEFFMQNETPEDRLAHKLFDKLNKVFVQAVEKYFEEIEDAKVPLNEAAPRATMNPRAVTKLDKTFDKFDKRVDKLVKSTTDDIMRLVLNAGDEKAPQVTTPEKRELQRKADLLQKSFEQQLKMFNAKKMQEVRRKIIDGIAAGKSHAQIKKDIKDDINTYKRKENPHEYEIQRIVRSELQKNANLLKLLKWKEQGFKKYRWVTSQDERVRPANKSQRKMALSMPWQNHRKRHNKIFNIDDALSGKDIFPGGSLNSTKKNINCRCTAVLEID